MAVTLFAAIDIGSYELELSIYEISPKKGIVQLETIRKVLSLGSDTYGKGMISFDKVDEMCKILEGFKLKMSEYQVNDYRACGTSAIREAENREIVLDQIRVRTGISIQVRSNSELRFLAYKAIAAKETEFNNIIQKGTAIAEVGSGSMQISLFDKDALVTTQNLKLGALRIAQEINSQDSTIAERHQLVQEMIDNDIATFKKLFLKDRGIKNIIATGAAAVYLSHATGERRQKISAQEFQTFYESLKRSNPEQIAAQYDIPVRSAALLVPGTMVYKRLLDVTGAEMLWVPGVRLGDGLAAEYAEEKKLIKFTHDFSQDILVASKNIGKRYQADKNHTQFVEKTALEIFDSMKKYHGLGKRERLLLQIITILHDVGKYISMRIPGECGYNIIMSTEIIGVSHHEREIIANVVKYNTIEYDYTATSGILDQDMRILIAKLLAILKMANALDRSHKQKLKSLKGTIKDQKLILAATATEDLLLENKQFERKADFFEEVYGIRPVLKLKKTV